MNGKWGWAALALALASLAGLAWWQSRHHRAVPQLQPGGYVMAAGGEASEVSFREDGYFARAVPGRGFTRGTWRQRGAAVEVTETLTGLAESRRWSLTLETPTSGTLDDGTPCTLEVRGRE